MEVMPTSIGAKVRVRLAVPALIFMFFSSLDRVNLSFAALEMNRDLGFTPSEYGFAAGIVFLGYLSGQYPSVLLLQRIGMRRWIALCAVLWGAATAGVAGIQAPLHLYVLRIVIGFAEGGLVPGMVLYLHRFASERDRASIFALPMLAIPLSIILGSPISGWIMSLAQPAGMAGWRVMLVAEALPVIVLGGIAWFYFPDHPGEARWLTGAERHWLTEHATTRERPRMNDWRALRLPMMWSVAALWFCLLSGAYGIMYWLPQVIKRLSGLDPVAVGLVNALPWAGAMLGMYANPRHSDASGERYWHVALPAALASLALLAAMTLENGVAALCALFVAGLGLGAAQGVFWALPTALLAPGALAVAAVAINMAGSSGGLVVPHLIGYLYQRSGSFSDAALLVVILLVVAAALAAAIGSVAAARERALRR